MWQRTVVLFFLLISSISLYANDDIVTKVIDVYDGDTFHINIPDIHPILGKHLPIRVNGIDAPEIKDRRLDKREAAQLSKSIAKTKLEGKMVRIHNIKRDKYFRLLADVEIVEGKQDFAQFMLDTQLARPYHGEKRK